MADITISGPQAGVAAATLDSWTSHAWENGLQLEAMSALDEIVVRTANSTYEITIVSPHGGDVLVRGGAFFPVFTRARVAGASLGGSFLKCRGIYVGFRLEFFADGVPIITTGVRSISRAAQPSTH